jgi:transcriptional regulator with XRE-family HTH domain
MDMAEVIRRRRTESGPSQADLTKAARIDTRHIRRYETGQQQPVLSVTVAIAKALGISVSELAGAPSHRVDLTGDWWTCWQTSRGSVEGAGCPQQPMTSVRSSSPPPIPTGWSSSPASS